jgi:hypothetical protein
LWCNFVWVCLGWRNFIFQMDGSNLPYESIWSFHLNLAEVPSKFHTISELNGSQFRWNKVPERWTSGARCSAAYRRQGWGRCRFPLGNRVEAVLFQLARMGCTRLLWRRTLWEVDGGEFPTQHFFPMAREPNKFGIDDSLCLYVDNIVYTLFW